jgi:hypothetical protein
MPDRYTSLVLVIAIVLALYIPTVLYPTTGDSLSFAMIAKHYAEGDSYIPDELNQNRMPLFSISSIPFAAITGNYMSGVRMAALVFGLVSIFAWFYIGRELFKDSKFFPLLMLCPMLILYALFRGLSDAPLICFSLLSILFFYRARKDSRYFYLCGLFFALAALSKYIGIFLGISYLLIHIIERRSLTKEFVIAMVLGFLVFGLILLSNFNAYGTVLPSAYSEKLSGEPAGLPFYIRPFMTAWVQIPDMMFFLLMSLPLLLFFVNGFARSFKRKDSSLIVFFVVSLGFGFVSGSSFRYLIPAIIFFLLITFSGFSSMKDRPGGHRKKLFVIGILFYLVMMPYFVNGTFKDAADSVFVTPATWGQDGIRNINAMTWMNINLPAGAVVITGNRPIFGEYLRDDISVLNYIDLQEVHGRGFYFLYDRMTPVAINNIYVHENGTAYRYSGNDIEGLTPEWDYLNERYDMETVFHEDVGQSIITLHELKPNM